MYTHKADKLKEIVVSQFLSTTGQAWEVEKNIWEVTTNDKQATNRGEMEELFNTQEKPPRCFVCNFMIWKIILQRKFAIPKDLHCILAVDIVYKKPNKKGNIQRVNIYNSVCFFL
jgi:hypothetical protein